LGRFEVVLLANLIDRLWDPRRCLEQLPTLIVPGGQLLITTPCTWLADYTPRANWLGGRQCNGRPIRTVDSLQEILRDSFDLSQTAELPFLLREHARKFQWSVASGTRWIRR
jgi:hypothetical protein